MNIIIVEDEIIVARSIKNYLQKEGSINIIEIEEDPLKALEKIKTNIFDLAIIDIFLGNDSCNGLKICQKVREKNKDIPIIIVSCAHQISYLEKAFTIGVNDYITKPFNKHELKLRIQRWSKMISKVRFHRKIKYKKFTYDYITNEFLYGQTKLKLSKKNKILLLLFLKNPEKLLTKDFIQEKLWGDYHNIEKNRNLRSNIQILRQSLLPELKNSIKTVRGEGYILKI